MSDKIDKNKVHAARSLLNETHSWPSEYMFKFVIKTDEKQKILDFFLGCTIEEKYSGGGKYTSITAYKMVDSAEEVLDIYQKVSLIKGVVSL